MAKESTKKAVKKLKQYKQKVPKGEFKNVRFCDDAKTHVKLTIGSQEWSVPAQIGDPIYDEILKKEITPTDFVQVDMKPEEVATYCDLVLADAYKKVPVDIWDDMAEAKKAKWKTYFNKVRNLPNTANLSGIAVQDVQAVLKLMPKQPT